MNKNNDPMLDIEEARNRLISSSRRTSTIVYLMLEKPDADRAIAAQLLLASAAAFTAALTAMPCTNVGDAKSANAISLPGWVVDGATFLVKGGTGQPCAVDLADHARALALVSCGNINKMIWSAADFARTWPCDAEGRPLDPGTPATPGSNGEPWVMVDTSGDDRPYFAGLVTGRYDWTGILSNAQRLSQSDAIDEAFAASRRFGALCVACPLSRAVEVTTWR